jgi:putative cell wall-binding protein
MIASVLALVSTPAGALATVASNVRVSGDTRFETANHAADQTKAVTDESHFVLANGNSAADGLSAAALAGALDTDGAAMLLTEGGTLTLSTLTTMARMSGGVAAGLRYVHLVGGTSVISEAIATQLTAQGYNVKRIAGNDRYGTANAVAAEVKLQNSGNVGTFSGYRTAFLVNGNGFADAIAASGIAYSNKLPIFLTDGSTLSAETVASMSANKIQKVMVLGGTAVVSDAVLAAALAVDTVVVAERIAGADRYSTATALAEKVAAVDTARRNKVVLVDGTNFPDGLAAGQYAAKISATILLVNGKVLPGTVTTWISGKQAYINEISPVGGNRAVPDEAVAEAKTAGTKPAITATISKITDNGTIARVTFSAQVVKAEAEDENNYIVTTKAGVAAKWAGTCTYTYTASTAASVANCTGGAAMAPGSTFTVTGGTIASTADAAVHVALTTYTQAAASGVPTATIHAIASAAGGADKVYVTFSEVPAFFADADITAVNQVSGAAAAVIDTCAAETPTIWACNVATNALAAGDMVKIAANSWKSGATTGVNAGASSTIAVTDITKPTLTNATFTTPVADTAASSQAEIRLIGKAGATVGMAGAGAITATKGDVIITALATGAYAGKAGNAVKGITVAGGANTCVFDAASKTITITTAAATLAPVITDACNANAAFAAGFKAATTSNGGTDFALTLHVAQTGGAKAMQGGLDKFSVTLTFSEPLAAFVVGDYTVSTNCATACNTADSVESVDETASSERAQELAGVMTLKVVSPTVPSAGLDKVTLTNSVTDRNANALLTGTGSEIVIMQLGS